VRGCGGIADRNILVNGPRDPRPDYAIGDRL
jgi:hypothetical protein